MNKYNRASIQTTGEQSLALREQRRDLQPGSPIPDSDDGVSPDEQKAFKETPRVDPQLAVPDKRNSARVDEKRGVWDGRLSLLEATREAQIDVHGVGEMNGRNKPGQIPIPGFDEAWRISSADRQIYRIQDCARGKRSSYDTHATRSNAKSPFADGGVTQTDPKHAS